MPKLSKLKIGLITALGTALLFMIAGLILFQFNPVYGIGLFILLPFACGFAVSTIAIPKITVIYSLFIFVPIALMGLISTEAEGFVCSMMALPLIVPGLLLGALFGFILRKYGKRDARKILLIMLTACISLGMSYVEPQFFHQSRVETIVNRISVEASPSEVWDQLKSFDGFSVEKPFLLKLGLPVPLQCTLSAEDERVGGKRVCHFDSGIIEEEIRVWDPPNQMKLEITRSTLMGRHWLSFVDASYEVVPDGERTVVIRTTRIASQLRPAAYWRIMERMGVEAEHRYILNQLEVDLN